MDVAARKGDLREENDAHCRFHIAMVGLAGQRQLLLAYQPVIRKLQLYMAANLRREVEHVGDPGRRRAPAQEALRRRGEPGRADRAGRARLTRGADVHRVTGR